MLSGDVAEDTRTEDKAPHRCDPSADSSAGMARGGFDAEAVPTQNHTGRDISLLRTKNGLAKGPTLLYRRAATF
jgi:hypothetical protein